jgi:hypothetical protein
MHYEINVSLNGAHFFATAPRSCQDKKHMQLVLASFITRFPKSQGYDIIVMKCNEVGTFIPLEDCLEKTVLEKGGYNSAPVPKAVNGKIPHFQVEFDLNFHGGDYDEVGDFAYVPVGLVAKMGMEKAFQEFTGHDPVHIIHYTEDELFDSEGVELDDE